MAAVHLINLSCSGFDLFVKFGICRQQNISLLMWCGIILLDVYLIAAGEKVHLTYIIIVVFFL